MLQPKESCSTHHPQTLSLPYMTTYPICLAHLREHSSRNNGCPLLTTVYLKVPAGTGFQDLVAHMLIITVCNAESPVTWQERLQPCQTVEQVCACLTEKTDHHWGFKAFSSSSN